MTGHTAYTKHHLQSWGLRKERHWTHTDLMSRGGDRQLKPPPRPPHCPIVHDGGKNGDCGAQRRHPSLSLGRKRGVQVLGIDEEGHPGWFEGCPARVTGNQLSHKSPKLHLGRWAACHQKSSLLTSIATKSWPGSLQFLGSWATCPSRGQ